MIQPRLMHSIYRVIRYSAFDRQPIKRPALGVAYTRREHCRHSRLGSQYRAAAKRPGRAAVIKKTRSRRDAWRVIITLFIKATVANRSAFFEAIKY